MHLLDNELRNKEERETTGTELPKFDREAMRAATREYPQWVHFGAGDTFRAFPAACQQKLLNDSVEKTGITVAEGYDYETIKKTYRSQGNLSFLITPKANDTIEKTVTGDLVQSLTADRHSEADWNRLKDIPVSEALRMVSFMITEKGYSVTSADGPFRSDVEVDSEASPERADDYIGKLAVLCYWRYTYRAAPLALASVDNCSHNGDKLYTAVDAYVKAWAENGKADKEFLRYIKNPVHVSLPWSMIDKITPHPGDSIEKVLEEVGFTDTESIITDKNTYMTPFVNIEEAEYLVIEDAFPNERPLFEKAGAMFTARDTVEKVECMKVCACLNPLHITLAVHDCPLGYTKINEEMKNVGLAKLIEIIGYGERLSAVTGPGISSPKRFIDEVSQIRVPNPFMPDTPQRIACDTSQKLSIRFGEIIKEHMAKSELDMKSPKFVPMIQAGWCHYLLGVDDEGNTSTMSPDLMYESLAEELKGMRIGEPRNVREVLRPILSDAKISGVGLYEVGLGEYVENIFAEVTTGRGVVRAALQKHLVEA